MVKTENEVLGYRWHVTLCGSKHGQTVPSCHFQDPIIAMKDLQGLNLKQFQLQSWWDSVGGWK